MVQIASFSFVLALVCVVYTVAASIIALRTHRQQWMKSATHAVIAIAGLLTLALFLLLYFLLGRDFRLAYVTAHTDVSLSPVYAISALWAGQEGSLLFWAWVISLCSVVFIWDFQKKSLKAHYGLRHVHRTLTKFSPFSSDLLYSLIALAVILGFFILLLIFNSNPFQVLQSAPMNGKGMNPLLQNPYMVVHPPILFIGYAGFGISFALAFAALCTGNISGTWITLMRRWVLFSWYFLGIGIVLGGHWAYLELGWGGYWAWDPVENASLIPWLTSTALLHTLILQQRKGLLIRWNIFLSLLTFLLCILGTFITRSGILESVHAYAESAAGFSFFLFLIITFLGMAGLFGCRWKHFQAQHSTPALFSKETSFFLANQLLMGLTFAILYGTLYPILAEIVTGRKVAIEAPFFNTVGIPLGVIILGLLAICQVLPWKRRSLKTLLGKLSIFVGIAVVFVIIIGILGVHKWPVLLTCSLGMLAIVTLIGNPKQFLRPFFWFHLGTATLCIAIAVSSTYKIEQRAELYPGESFTSGHLRFHYLEKILHEDGLQGVVTAHVKVYKDNKHIATLTPEKRFYGDPSSPQITTEIGLSSSLKQDIYLILEGWDEDQRSYFRVIISPIILWIWIGGFGMFTLGFLLEIGPRKSRRVLE